MTLCCLPPAQAAEEGQAQAQLGTALNLDDALLAAYQANPTLAAVIAQRPVTESALVQAKIRINPTYNNEFAPAEATYHFFDIKTTTQLGFKRQRRIEVAQRQIDSTNATIRTMAWKIRQDTELAFFDVIIAREILRVMQDYVDVTKRLFAIAEQRMQSRDASGLEVLRADAAVSDAKTQLAPAVVHVQQARRQLNIMLGRNPDDAIDAASPSFLNLDRVPARLPEFNQLLTTAELFRPEYQQNSADLAVQKAKIRQAKSLRWPDVQVDIGMSSVPSSADTNYWGTHVVNRPLLYTQIPITIFDHGQGAEALARASYLQLQAQRKALTTQIRQELNLSYSNARAAEEQLDIFVQETLPKQAKVVVLTQKGYGAGVIDLTGAITAQQAALTTRLNFLQAATRYFQSLVELERSAGKPMLADLVAPQRTQ